MNPVLNRNLFFIKQHAGLFKAANNFDIYDPADQQLIMTCREAKPGFFTRMLRFSAYKRMVPFHVEIRTASGEQVLSVKRGVSLFSSTVEVLDENHVLAGRFLQKKFTIGGRFDVTDPQGNMLCTVKGSWTNWDFSFGNDSGELAHVSKKWAGTGREMFTSADNYMLQVRENVSADDPVRILILAAVLCIDMVLKE